MHETSSVLVDPVSRSMTTSQQAAPGWGTSDASRVVAKGLGLTKGFISQKNSFSVDCSKAGMTGRFTYSNNSAKMDFVSQKQTSAFTTFYGFNVFVPYLAGRNMLLIGVDGPKVPCEEILVKHIGNRLYNVSYQLKEKGEYILVVKWGDEHIPGSPYHITV